MITKGQARRIAADWHAAGNSCSALSHVGEIEEGLDDELASNLTFTLGRTDGDQEDIDNAARELRALRVFAQHYGVGKISGWGAWDETPAGV